MGGVKNNSETADRQIVITRILNVVITFEDQGNKTKLTMQSIFPTATIREMVIREYGADEGGNQTIDHWNKN